MLDSVIKKLTLILVLCGGIACIIYFTDLGAILKGETEEKVKKKVEEFKKDVEEKLNVKKEKVEVEVNKVEDKIKNAKEKVEELKKIKLKDIIK
jgi:gas vesicle protein